MLKERTSSSKSFTGGGSIANTNTAKTANKTRHHTELLQFYTPLLVTESVRVEDEYQDKIRRRESQKKNRNRKSTIRSREYAIPLHNLCLDAVPPTSVKKVLEKVHSPLNWERRGETFRQTISDASTTRLGVIQLKAELDKRLKEFGTDVVGMCRERIDLFSNCFDEVIRQVSISCVERGNLLLEVRDEINRTFVSYESLFGSAISYGIRKKLKCQERIEELERGIFNVNDEIVELYEIQNEFQPAIKHFEEKFANQREVDEQNFNSEYERLLKNNQILKDLLTNSISKNSLFETEQVPI